MPLYLYSAVDKGGRNITGEKEAENERALAESLKKEGTFLLEIKSREKKLRILDNPNVNDIFARFRRITLVDRMFFTRNLMVMINAGLSLNKALDALARESTNPTFKKVIEDVNASIVKGKSFAESLKLHENVFDSLFINMIEVGETTGKLALVLKLAANQLKKDHELRSRVKNAMMYPAIIVAALLIIGSLMMIYVVPNLAKTLQDLGTTLPVSTKIIIFISDLMTHNLPYFLGSIAIIIVGVWRLSKIKKVKDAFDRIVLRLPIFGELTIKFNTSRFCRTLAYLVASGVPITKSLEITSSVLGNSVYSGVVMLASVEVQKGKQINQILKEKPQIFQPVVTQMIQVGEETGKLSDMLLRLAMFFEEDVNNTTKNLTIIIEPILMIFIGGAVAFFAISMLQPIYSSMNNI